VARQVKPRSADGQATAPQKFARALEALVEHVKADRSVVAAVLCGSLSHDTVWAKSDIDLVLVTVDEKKPPSTGRWRSLYADGVNVHANLVSRSEFRRIVEGSMHNSFMHSLLAKGRLLYTHDDTIHDLFARLREIGDRDTQLQLLRAGTGALGPIYKAHKWFITRGDLEYTALWILYAATALAKIEVISAGLIVDREAIPHAMTLNPAFFKTVYVDLLNTPKTQKSVKAALDAIDGYIAARASSLFRVLIDYLDEAGEARSTSEIEDHFRRNFDVSDVTTACEYLADEGVLGKASLPVKITTKSNVEVQELAFFFSHESDRGRV
jgi:predicted nucleotidyltransferase